MGIVEILEIIQTHGLSPPHEVEIKIEDTSKKRWITVKMITSALIRALIQDFEKQKKGGHFVAEKLGWRNKHRIHLLSEDKTGKRVSHRQLYGSVIIEDLCDNDFLEIRSSKSRWGNQKYEYRLNLDFLPVSDFLIESVRLFVEGKDE